MVPPTQPNNRFGCLEMNFNAFNPHTTNSLNMAARESNIDELQRLLKVKNPNCVDNRGWTCLHEAAANDRCECVELILEHPKCRPLAETFEGHTALYLACRNRCSLKCIKVLLDKVEDIAQYASTEMVSPLHVACQQGRIELVELLLQYNSIVDLRDFDGDTPLHDAAFSKHPLVSSILLHAGADPEIRNLSGCTPFHLACMQGCLESVKVSFPFVSDIDAWAVCNETALFIASKTSTLETVKFLLEHKANPNVINDDGKSALMMALTFGNSDIFIELLTVMDKDIISRDIFLMACKPHYFKIDIIIALLESDLGPEFFNVCEKFYVTLEEISGMQPVYKVSSALNAFLHISEYIYNHSLELFRKLFYLFLMRGASVDALYADECPPLVYLHYCEHINSCTEIIETLVGQGCDVDYSSGAALPDAVLAALATGAHTLPTLLRYSLRCEPTQLLTFIFQAGLVGRTSLIVQQKIFDLTGTKESIADTGIENISNITPTLKHHCRLKIRETLRLHGISSTKDFFKVLQCLPLPIVLLNFLRYV